jgi:hypothetical protein
MTTGRYGAGPGVLRAQACAAAHPGGTPEVLWSAPLPAGDGGGSAPWQKVLVLGGPTPGQPTVLVGGHQSGSCFRGHCAASHSAVAAIRAPAGVDPPPIPPVSSQAARHSKTPPTLVICTSTPPLPALDDWSCMGWLWQIACQCGHNAAVGCFSYTGWR